jgi:galactokinase
VNFVSDDAVADFEQSIKREYATKTGLVPEVFVTAAAEGAGTISTEAAWTKE